MREGVETSEPDVSEHSTASTMSEAEAREGYKWVQLGPKSIEIPEEWMVSVLNEVSDINMGSSPSSEYYNESENGLPFFQGNADFGYRYPTPEVWCTEPDKVAEEGDILISIRAPVGELNFANTECCIGRGLAAIRGTTSDSEFVFYSLSYSRHRLESYAQGSTFDSVNSKVLQNFPVAFPKIPEQRRIAEVLSTVDRQIRQTEEVIKNTRELKTGFLQDYYRSPEHGAPSADPPSREPDRWEAASLAELCTIGGGSTPSKKHSQYWGGDMPWCTPKEFDKIGVINDTEDHVTEEGIAEASLTVYSPDSTLVVVRSNAIKRRLPIAKITVPATVNQDIKALEPNQDRVEPEYLSQILRYNSERIRLTCRKSGTTIDSIETAFLQSYEIMLPTIEEQRRVSDFLSNLDTKVEQELEYRSRLQELKRGLMQDLLTGTVRVPESIEVED